MFTFKSNREFLYLGCRKNSFLILLLLLCGDIERCPGPLSITAFFKQRGIKFVHQNICGLVNKIPHLETFVSDALPKAAVISLSETHINGFTDNDELYKLPGYTFIKSNRKKWSWWCGWYLFEKWTELQTMGRSTKLSHRQIVFKMKCILFGCYYRTPNFSNDMDQLIIE